MGSPLGPTLANIFLSHHETTWLNECPVQFKPVYYRRYVDDIVVLFKSRNHVKKFRKYLNSRHKCMSFSVEEEKDNKLSFLDVKVTREDNKFITSTYRKSTFSGVYLNFKSFVPTEYKHGLIFTLLFRTYTLCSNYTLLHTEIENLKTIWQKNSYPLFFIDKVIYRFLDQLFIKRKKFIGPLKKEVGVTITYTGTSSIEMRNRLRSIFRHCVPYLRLKVMFTSKNRLKNRFSFKDVLPKALDSLIVYKFTCSTCFSTYIGKTKRHFLVRAYEHLGLSYKTDKGLKYTENAATSIRKHLDTCNHKASLDDFKVIGRARNDFHVKVKESLAISIATPSLNNADESIPLHLF